MSGLAKSKGLAFNTDSSEGGGGGSTATITLLSITTAPTGTFEKGSKYYNSTTRLIYTATADDVWGTDGETPKFNTIYIYDNNGTTEYYIWDGDNLVETDLEKYQLKSNITDSFDSSSQVTYPSSKALKDGLETAKPNLFDIKLLSQAIADKGWACLLHTTRKDIAKTSVPTLYNDILEKYNNCDKAELPWTDGVSSGDGFIDNHNGVVYSAISGNTIGKSTNPKTVAFTTFATLTNSIKSWTLKCLSKWIIIYCNNNIISIIDYETGNSKDLSYTSSNLYFKEIGSYVYIIDTGNNKIAKIPNVSYADIDVNSITDVVSFTDSGYSNITDIEYDSTNNKWYLVSSKISSGSWSIIYTYDTTDLTDLSKYNWNLWTAQYFENIGRVNITKYNNRLCVYGCCKAGLFFRYTDNFFSTATTLDFFTKINTGDFYVRGSQLHIAGYQVYSSGGNEYQRPSYGKINLVTLEYSTTNFGYENSNAHIQIRNVTATENNTYIIWIENWSGKIRYSGLAPVQYSDVINGTTIYYYKYNDWKICLAGENGTNDVNLDTVYNYLGYLNYWLLDTTSGSETISLPRNSNLWTMMYVGDDYEDSNLPSGEYSAVALKSETKYLIKDVDVSSTITINLDKEHKAYQITTPTSNFSLSIDNTNCPIGKEVKDIILIIDMSASAQAYEITWANNIKWGNTSPTMTALVKYMFSFTTIDGGQTWIGNQMFSWQ